MLNMLKILPPYIYQKKLSQTCDHLPLISTLAAVTSNPELLSFDNRASVYTG